MHGRTKALVDALLAFFSSIGCSKLGTFGKVGGGAYIIGHYNNIKFTADVNHDSLYIGIYEDSVIFLSDVSWHTLPDISDPNFFGCLRQLLNNKHANKSLSQK